MKRKTQNYQRGIVICLIFLFLIVAIFNIARLFHVQHLAAASELPTIEVLPNKDSLLFTPKSISKIEVNTYMSKIANPFSIATVENKFCLLIHRLDLADGFSMQNAIKISDLDTTPTDLILYRFYSKGPADINFGEIASNPTSNIFLTISGDSIKKTIQNDSIESYKILCNSVYFRFSSRDTINMYFTSDPKPLHQYKFPADILFWKKEKSLYLFMMFPLDSDKPISDDEIFKMLNFH